MRDEDKTKSELIEELVALRRRIGKYETLQSELKRSKEDLLYQQKHLESLINCSPLGIIMLDEAQHIVSCNRKFKEIFLFNDSEIIGKDLDEIVAGPQNLMKAKSYTRETLEGKMIHSLGSRQRKDGSMVEVEFFGVPIFTDGSLIGAYGIYQDITELKRTEDKLCESEKQYRNIFDNAQVGLFRSRFSDSKLLNCNSRYAEMFGYESQRDCIAEVFAGDHYLYPEDRKYMLKIIEKCGRIDNFECPVLRKDGTVIFIRYSAHLDKKDNYIEGVVVDITEKKLVEEELQNQLMRNEMILQTAIAGFCLLNVEGTINQVNDTACRILGFPREKLINNRLQVFIDSQSYQALLKHSVRVNKNGSDCFEMKYQQDKNRLYLLICTNKLETDEGKYYFSFFNDITQRKLVQLALHEREKELEANTEALEELNTALKVLLKRREEDKTQLEENTLHSIKDIIMPYLQTLRKSRLTERQAAYLEIIELSLNDIISPFSRRLTSTHLKLTPGELQIANLIKHGKSTKAIADLLCLSPETVSFHRKNIRKKMGIQKQNTNLRTLLQTLEE